MSLPRSREHHPLEKADQQIDKAGLVIVDDPVLPLPARLGFSKVTVRGGVRSAKHFLGRLARSPLSLCKRTFFLLLCCTFSRQSF